MRRRRREHIASVEGLAHLRQAIGGSLDRDRGPRTFLERKREQTVVWTYEVMAGGRERESAPGAAHARIDYRQMNGAGRKEAPGGFDGEGSFQDIVRRDVVSQVDDARVWGNAKDHPLQDSGEGVAKTEIGRQRDDRRRHLVWRSRGRGPVSPLGVSSRDRRR